MSPLEEAEQELTAARVALALVTPGTDDAAAHARYVSRRAHRDYLRNLARVGSAAVDSAAAAEREAYEAEMRAEGYAKARGLAVAMLLTLLALVVIALIAFGPTVLAWLGWP